MAVCISRLFQISVLSLLTCQIAFGQHATPSQLNLLIQQGRIDEATQLARQLDEAAAGDAKLTLPLARLARESERAGQIEQSAEFYGRAITALERTPKDELSVTTKVVLRLAAGAVLARSGNYESAVAAAAPVLEAAESVTDQQRNLAVAICLRAGGQALSSGDWLTATQAYQLAVPHADQADKPTALLGDAWAAVLRGDQPWIAAGKLTAFCQQFPTHVDAPAAARACVECYRQAGDQQAINQAATTLLQQWPDSPAASELAGSFCDRSIELVPDAVKTWLIEKATSDASQPFDAPLCVIGILAASSRDEPAAWSKLVNRLAQIDQTGQPTTGLLSQLPAAAAERVAGAVLSSTDPRPTSGVIEAAARWAADTQRWSMLASAAAAQSPGTDTASLTVSTERLFAESLMQLGRTDEAKPWWDHLVDVRLVDDFSTLLRCAEAETAVGADTQAAQRRISAVRDAVGEEPLRICLIHLLEAQLQIRQSKFDQARATLDQIVRAANIDASIRGRAQWLIGETHYLQQKFIEAIDAYRKVEQMDGITEGTGRSWVAAALVQAGKSFEQLGRTREAALCYGNLLNRFPDSGHTVLARHRLAVLEPHPRHGDAPNSSQTIRR